MDIRKYVYRRLACLSILAVSPSWAWAEELNGADSSWILVATALVLLMTLPGLSLFYAGLVRRQNVLSVLMQCFSIACLVSILWFLIGYSLAFSEGNGFIGGLGNAFMINTTKESLYGGIPETLFAMFQMTFAIITPALIIGGFAERARFSAVLLFSAVWLIAVYVPVTHWVWGSGWLAAMGAMDFAGGLVVHITAGVAALVAAITIGNRNEFGEVPMPPHNLPMSVTGAGMLWVGWFGFNAGSALAANSDAAMTMLVTHISASAGALAWVAMERLGHGKASVLGIITGMVAGLGSITPASGFVGPGGALIIGLSAGCICYFATHLIKKKFCIDDSLDVFPVHAVGGVLGTLLVAVLASENLGLFSGFGYPEGMGMGRQLGVQVLAVVSTAAYTAAVTWVILKVVDKLLGLRVSYEEEALGLDLSQHDESAYNP